MLGWAIIAAIALRVLIPRWQKRPPNRAAAVAARPLGVQPTGPDGTWTRRDYLRAAGFSSTVALGLAALTYAGGALAQRSAVGSTMDRVATGMMFLGGFGLVLAIGMTLIHLVKAAITRQPAEHHSA